MTPEDKQKLINASRRWLDENPYSDSPFDNVSMNGERMTPRMFEEWAIASGSLFKEAEAAMAKRNITLDEFIILNYGPQPVEEILPKRRYGRRTTAPRKWKI